MYNVGNLIGKAIQSVLSQTFTEWELIIINDGSTDNSREIALAKSNRDDRISIYDKTNGGLSDARNFGFRLAKGDFVHFFDSDDWISNEFYEDLYDTAISCSADVVISGYTIDAYKKDGRCTEYKKELDTNISTPLNLSNFISSYFNFAWNKIFKRYFLISNNLQYEVGLKLIEDCEFMSRFVQFSPKVCYNNSCGYHYRNDSRKTLSRFFDEILISNNSRRILCTKSIIEFISKDQSLNEIAIDFIRINSIRFLIHSLFAFTKGIQFKQKIKLVKEIISDDNLRITRIPSQHISKKEIILWKLVLYKRPFILSLLYQLKER